MDMEFRLGISTEETESGQQQVVLYVNDREACRYAPGTKDRERALHDGEMRMMVVMRQLFLGWGEDR